jgi:hypothetical protein
MKDIENYENIEMKNASKRMCGCDNYCLIF